MLITVAENVIKKILTNKIFKATIVLILLSNMLFSFILSSIAVPVANMSDVKTPLTAERAGNYVSNFAINFEKNFGKKVQYSTVSTEVGDTYNGTDVSGKYCMNNTSWVAFVYNQCLKLQGNTNVPLMNVNNFVTPHTQGTLATWNEDFFEQIKFNGDAYAKEDGNENKKTEHLNISTLATNDEIHPGDILIKSKYNEPKEGETPQEYKGEVFLYIGAGQLIYCREPQDDNDKIVLEKCYIDDLDCTIDSVIRIKEEVAKEIFDMDTTMMFDGKTYDAGIKYQGIPGYGTYLGTTTLDIGRWLIDHIGDVLDYLVGILLYAVKAILIGWVNLVENLLHDTLMGSAENAAGKNIPTMFASSSGSYVNSLTGKANNLGTRISIEDMIFNKIPILDVNFFEVNQAGGCEISQDSMVYMIRQNVAQWYYIIRLVSIVIMLLILIYVGIRIAISSTGGKKAQYKSALTGWAVGFIAVMSVHFFMYVIFKLNESFVGTFEEIALKMNGGEFSIYETIRTKSYSPKFTEGFGSTVIYMVLVYTLVKFTMIYFKRYLTVTILGLIGPIIGLKYAVERATGKKTKSIGSWMFEFAMNVLLQGVHSILYIVLMQIAIGLAMQSLAGFVLALVILNFMLKSDKIFMKIFSFDKSKSVGDTSQQEGLLQQFTKLRWGTELTLNAVGRFGKGVKSGVGNVIQFKNYAGDVWFDREEGETKKSYQRFWYRQAGRLARRANRVTRDKISTIAAMSLLRGTKDSKKLDKAAIAAMKVNFQTTQKIYKRSVKALKGSVGAAAKLAMAIPVTVADPLAGVGMVSSAVGAIRGNNDRTSINNKEIEKEYEDYIDARNRGENPNVKKARRKKKIESIIKAPMNAQSSFLGATAIRNAGLDVDKYEEARLKNHRAIENLKKADITEGEIEKLYKELKTEISNNNASLTNEQLTEKVNKVFGKTVKEAVTQRVKGNTIKDAVGQYMTNNNLMSLSELDIKNIMDIIKLRQHELGKKLVFDNDALDNIRQALQEKIDENVAKRRGSEVGASEMEGAIKKGLTKKGSIKSSVVDSSSTTKEEEIKTKIQQKVREYENTYESSGKTVERVGVILKRVKDQ